LFHLFRDQEQGYRALATFVFYEATHHPAMPGLGVKAPLKPVIASPPIDFDPLALASKAKLQGKG
jgi:hypothetical protein